MSWLGLVAIFALLLANAYCVAAEFALVSVRRSQVQLWVSEQRRSATAVARALDRLDDSFAATQLGITLSSIGLGFLGEPALARGLEAPLHALGFGAAGIHGVAVGVAFTIVTFLHVVLGELMPRAIGLNRAPAVALACAPSLIWIARIFRPAIAVLNGAGNLGLRALGVPPARHGANTHSAMELAALVRDAGDAGVLRSDAVQMLGNVFRISDKRVIDVMIPRDQVRAIPRDIAMEPLLDLIREEGFT
ncbi:MAG TPA: hemolysin family protein, partial [Myxococcota bacterium]